jgi:CDP-glucose 4,6-dehydratase
MFSNAYKGKKVLITGHTGFKGSWLTTWLIKLGAEVIGFSIDIPTEPSMFVSLDLENKIDHNIGDIRDFEKLSEIIEKKRPDFIFHLAAQAIVSKSYSTPVETMTTNVIGTMNILESLRILNYPCVLIMITSDKCYDNVEWLWGYKESDHLGGKDIYSGSKGAAELVIKSYVNSFFGEGHMVRVGTGRAGNVIGGGDWALDRIVVDCMKSWHSQKSVEIRSPNATRPWQHVLEPLSGYLQLGAEIFKNNELHGEAFNFGPKSERNHTVIDLLSDLSSHLNLSQNFEPYKVTDNIPFHEAGLLKLNCDKAMYFLKWEANLNYEETIKFVADWYINYFKSNIDMYKLTNSQIDDYEFKASKSNKKWSH